jgi:hypothetical protein
LWFLALISLLLGGVALGQFAHAGYLQLEREVDEAVQVEVGTLVERGLSSDPREAKVIVDAATLGESPQVESEIITVKGDRAAARALLHVGDDEVWRQVRFYHRTESGWHPMPPDESLWGAPQELQSRYFIFRYHSRDKIAVAAASVRLDEIYSTLLEELGVPQPETQRIIVVSLYHRPGIAYQEVEPDVVWEVASPALYLAPVTLSDSELLVQAITLPLLRDVLAQAQAYYGMKWQWRPFYSGLELWALWKQQLPLAHWRTDLTTWYFEFADAGTPRTPPEYGDLCASHLLWMDALVDIHIPYLCSSMDAMISCCYPRSIVRDLHKLESICKPFCQWDLEQQTTSWGYCTGESIAISTVIEYAVEKYGIERLPVLLAALNEYETWDVIVRAVYGVSEEEFELGWQEYVDTHYRQVPPAMSTP